jgi:ABC-type sulfate transport system permease component
MLFEGKMMQRTVVIFKQVLFILLLIALPLILVCKKSGESPPQDALDALLNSGGLELIHEVPLQFATYHVQ